MRRVILLVCALAVGLTGCSSLAALPYAHEIEDTVLMRTLGVDVGTADLDGVAVTASSAGRPGAGDSPGQAPVVLSAQAGTVSAACLTMQTFGKAEIFFGDVEQVLVGEGQAQRGLGDLLSHMARDSELRLEAQVWAVMGGSAGGVLFGAEEEGGAADRLEAIQADAGLFSAALPRTAREILVDLERNGCTFLPALLQSPARPGDGAEGESALSSPGYALCRGGALAGWATGEAAHGVNLLLGEVDSDILELTTPGCVKAAVRISGGRTRCVPVFTDGVLTGLSVWCGLEAAVTELRGCRSLGREDRAWLEGELSRVSRGRMELLLDQAQAMGADFLNLEGKCALSAPWHKDELAGQWAQAFPGLSVTIQVDVNIARE